MLAKLLNRKKADEESATPADPSGENASLMTLDATPQSPHEAPPAAPKLSVARKSKSDRWDWVIASVCISAGVVGLRTVNDPVLWSEFSRGTGGSHSIGTLIKKKGGVRFRSAESPLWHDVYSGSEEVAAGDTVFTGDDGMAELRLDDNTVAEIEPNSLIVVQRSADVLPDQKGWLGSAVGNFFATSKPQSLLRIEQGSAKLKLKKNAGPLKLQLKGKVYNLSSSSSSANGATAEVSVDGRAVRSGGGAKFASLSADSVDLAEDSEEGKASKVVFGQGQQAVLHAENAGAAKLALQSVAMTPLLPQPGEQMMLPPRDPVTFTWKWEGGPSSQASQAQLEFDGPEGKTVPVTGSAESVKLELSQGAYRWRLLAQFANGAHVETSWQSFSLLRLAPPRPVGPLSGAWIAVPRGESAANVVFSWQELPSGLQAEVQWGLKPKNTGGELESAHLAAGEAGGKQVSLVPGAYQWRVRSRSAEHGQFSEWSPSLAFTVMAEVDAKAASPTDVSSVVLAAPAPVAPAAPVAPPVPVAPLAEAKKAAAPKPTPPKRKPVRVLAIGSATGSTKLGSSERLDRVTIPLRWQPLEEVKSYQVVVTDDTTGKRIWDKASKVPSLNLALHTLESTRFTYQVTAITDSGEKIVSAPVPFEIQLSAPILKTPSDGTRVTPNKQGTMLTTWERTVLTESYIVEYTQDPSFTRNVHRETVSRNLLSLRGLTMGVSYFWRVQSISHGHKSEWSQSSMFVLENR